MSETIAIVGAGICGMCTGLALAKRGHKVTLYERDSPPPAGDADQAFFDWNRLGAAQFRHPHAFLGLMCSLLEERYPDLVEDFYEAGARRVEFTDLLSSQQLSRYIPQAGDEKLWLLLCRRATMETVLRRYVVRLNNVEIVSNCSVEQVLAEKAHGAIRVRGIRISRDGVESDVPADVVIDASGRTSRFRHWFSGLGVAIPEEKDDAGIVYYTRHYKLAPGVKEPVRNSHSPSSGDIGYLKFGVFPGDNGHFAVILCVPVNEETLKQAIRDGDTFDRVCRHIPGLLPWLEPGKSIPTTDSFGIGDIHSVWRHYVVDGVPVAHNFFAVGDAALRTNPLYGRGCSTGIWHAHLLAGLLDEVTEPAERARRFDAITEAELRPIFKASLSEDQRGIRRALAVMDGDLLDRPDTFRKWFRLAFADALSAASKEDVRVLRGAMRTFNLLEKPGEFLNDWNIRLTVLRYMLRGRKRNTAQRRRRGPSRGEMLALIQQA
ncbi:MAG: FAD-dependent oxidoreductase [Pseudomonadales bacterium]